MKNHFLFVFSLAALLMVPNLASASDNKMTAEVSTDLVQINTGFDGMNLLLFGTTNGANNIIIVIKGPLETNIIRKKTRVASIWVNTEKVIIENVPTFYAIASTRPLNQITTQSILKKYGIGANNFLTNILKQANAKTMDISDEYKNALVRLKNKLGLYIDNPIKIKLIEEQLFRANIKFPANVGTGKYTAQIYYFKDGLLLDVINKPILVEKIGIGADVFRLAHSHSALYGIIAILIAVASGWIAAAIFRKV
tara:strand:- start:93 stop:851 length:759 start_codon:yes stop_codon:yes gene_type:complete